MGGGTRQKAYPLTLEGTVLDDGDKETQAFLVLRERWIRTGVTLRFNCQSFLQSVRLLLVMNVEIDV
jgi:hypothetical protein